MTKKDQIMFPSNHLLKLALGFLSSVCLIIGIIFFASSFKSGEISFFLAILSVSISLALFGVVRAISLCEKLITDKDSRTAGRV